MHAMNQPGPMTYRLLADLLLLIHVSFVVFVVFGLLLTVTGLLLRWRWVRNFWFRAAHLLAIAVVVGQAWSGVMCPLTTWENQLRLRAGEAAYPGSFVAYWLHRLLYYRAEPWVFTICYSVFGALVLATFVFGAPQWPRRAVQD
jgi:hypothetical protein